MYPCCVGHEIIGIAARVGSSVTNGIKVGDRVGVGAQSESCLGRLGDCPDCVMGPEQYCTPTSSSAPTTAPTSTAVNPTAAMRCTTVCLRTLPSRSLTAFRLLMRHP